MLIAQMLHEIAGRFPENEAIVYGQTRTSYLELRQNVTALAGGLAGIGIGPGRNVVMLLDNVPEFVTGFFALSSTGALAVPLDPKAKDEELSYFLNNVQPCAVLTQEKYSIRINSLVCSQDLAATIILVDSIDSDKETFESLMSGNGSDFYKDLPPDTNCLCQFSSGSTGIPKQVVRTHEQLWHESRNFTDTCSITGGDAFLCVVPLYHAHGFSNCMLAAIRNGAKLVLMDEPHPFMLRRQHALQLLEEEKISIFPAVPFTYQCLAGLKKVPLLPALRLCFSAGMGLPLETFNAMLETFNFPVRQLYGCTEAGSVSINLDPDFIATATSVGKPMRRVQIFIVNDDSCEVPQGEQGEVTFTSPALTRGYTGEAELNARVFRDGRYYTGDIGYIDEGGRLFVTGRKRVLIEIAGYKVDGREVENVLVTHPLVKEVAVVAIKAGDGKNELLKAVIVAKERCEEKDLANFCAQRLADHKVPRVFEFRGELPRSPLGKLLREELV